MYFYLFIIYGICLLAMGVIYTLCNDRSSKLQTIITVVVFGIIFSLIVIAFLEHSWAIFIADVAMYFLLPGIGRTLALMVFGEWDDINPLACIVTLLFIIVLFYALATGRIVTYV